MTKKDVDKIAKAITEKKDFTGGTKSLDPKRRANIYLKTEFTDLQQNGQLISFALLSEENGSMFYAELNDYTKQDCSEFVTNNVLTKLMINDVESARARQNVGERGTSGKIAYSINMKGDHAAVRKDLIKWLQNEHALIQYRNPTKEIALQFVCDVCAYDWVFFMDLLAEDGNAARFGASDMGQYISYIPFDMSTMLLMYSMDPDIDREAFAGEGAIESIKEMLAGASDSDCFNRFNAIYDAYVLSICYMKLITAHMDIIIDAVEKG